MKTKVSICLCVVGDFLLSLHSEALKTYNTVKCLY